jgi:hypothetical protein
VNTSTAIVADGERRSRRSIFNPSHPEHRGLRVSWAASGEFPALEAYAPHAGAAQS